MEPTEDPFLKPLEISSQTIREVRSYFESANQMLKHLGLDLSPRFLEDNRNIASIQEWLDEEDGHFAGYQIELVYGEDEDRYDIQIMSDGAIEAYRTLVINKPNWYKFIEVRAVYNFQGLQTFLINIEQREPLETAGTKGSASILYNFFTQFFKGQNTLDINISLSGYRNDKERDQIFKLERTLQPDSIDKLSQNESENVVDILGRVGIHAENLVKFEDIYSIAIEYVIKHLRR